MLPSWMRKKSIFRRWWRAEHRPSSVLYSSSRSLSGSDKNAERRGSQVNYQRAPLESDFGDLALASSVAAQNAASSEVLLTRIRAHMREEFSRLPNNILLTDGATLYYRGEERAQGRRTVRYDYHWPRALDGFEIDIPEGREAGGGGFVSRCGRDAADGNAIGGLANYATVDRLSVPSSLRMTWITRSLAR
jgi:hypothetical protein